MTSFARALFWHASRTAYRALPIPDAAKRRFKNVLYRRLGFLIRDTATYRIWTETQLISSADRTAVGPASFDGSQRFGAGASSDSVFLVGRAIETDDMWFAGNHRTVKPTKLTPATILRKIVKRKLEARRAKTFYDEMAGAELRRFIDSREDLCLPCAVPPQVSVILILHNRADLTYLCLVSILQTVDLPVEVIIVDNASTDDTAILLERMSGARIIRNRGNLGFLKAVNQALQETTGKHVLLLNNDALLFPGALAAALATLESALDIGAIGGRIVLPDGRLQEAGSIVWNDGSCLGYGRGAHPDDPAFLYRRDVDYCSGAFLLVRRDLFLELGGFDETFAPAYYEETDFCMRLRAHGYRVVYEPDAVILHYEFASAASQDQALEQQEINRKKFAAKHGNVLSQHCSPGPENLPMARSSARLEPRLLLVDDYVPHRGLGAGFPRANDIVHGLVALGNFVTIYPTGTREEDPARLYSELPREVEVILGRSFQGLKTFLEGRRSFYDAILISRPNNMIAFNEIYEANRTLFEDTRIIYDAEAIFAHRDIAKQRMNGTEPSVEAAEDKVRAEIDLGRSAHRIAVVSKAEAAEFTKRGLANVQVLGHQVVARPSPRAFEERHGVLFVGAIQGDDTPNADSVLWFGKAVWPILSKHLPEDTAFVIAGTNRSRAVWSLNADRISVRGFVEDLGPLYDSCRLFVVPTRYAAGLPYKAHEAAAYGLPMVTTSLIADQLSWKDGEDLLVADAPEDMAGQCLRLYQDRAVWQGLRDSALRRIETECSRDSFRAALAGLVENADSLRAVSMGD